MFALYPQLKTRARGKYLGTKSGWFSQQTLDFEDQDLMASPPRPWTAIILVGGSWSAAGVVDATEMYLLDVSRPIGGAIKLMDSEYLLLADGVHDCGVGTRQLLLPAKDRSEGTKDRRLIRTTLLVTAARVSAAVTERSLSSPTSCATAVEVQSDQTSSVGA